MANKSSTTACSPNSEGTQPHLGGPVMSLSFRAPPRRGNPHSRVISSALESLNGGCAEPAVGTRSRSHTLKEGAWEEDREKCTGPFLFLRYVSVLCSCAFADSGLPFPPLMSPIYPQRVRTVKAGIQKIQALTSKVGFHSYLTVLIKSQTSEAFFISFC